MEDLRVWYVAYMIMYAIKFFSALVQFCYTRSIDPVSIAELRQCE